MARGGWSAPVRTWSTGARRGRALVGLVAFALAIALASAFAGSASASTSPAECAEQIIDDWSNGTLGSVAHTPDCYEAAIDSLPEDLRAYTTAADDISRASIAAFRATASSRETRQPADSNVRDEGLRRIPWQVLLVSAFGAAVVASGAAASLIRRRRAR
jgi:hypothetical protein